MAAMNIGSITAENSCRKSRTLTLALENEVSTSSPLATGVVSGREDINDKDACRAG